MLTFSNINNKVNNMENVKSVKLSFCLRQAMLINLILMFICLIPTTLDLADLTEGATAFGVVAGVTFVQWIIMLAVDGLRG